MKIRKIHLMSLMSILADIYDKGVDFIDIYGIIENNEDTIGISFSKAYMDSNLADNFDLFEEDQMPSRISVKLSDDDLNELM